jgi:hypothetical protein
LNFWYDSDGRCSISRKRKALFESDNLPEGLLSINVELILIIQVDEGFK